MVINVHVCVVSFLCKWAPAAVLSVMAGVCFSNDTMRGAGNMPNTHTQIKTHAYIHIPVMDADKYTEVMCEQMHNGGNPNSSTKKLTG